MSSECANCRYDVTSCPPSSGLGLCLHHSLDEEFPCSFVAECQSSLSEIRADGVDNMCAFLPREEWGYGPLLHKLIDAGEELFVKELRAGQQQQEFLVLEGGEGGSEMRGREGQREGGGGRGMG